MNIKARLAKLERDFQIGDMPVFVWCDSEADIPATIKAMIAAGEITEADASRYVFVHWLSAKANIGAHEAALSDLAPEITGQKQSE
jgi:hypothetical protein